MIVVTHNSPPVYVAVSIHPRSRASTEVGLLLYLGEKLESTEKIGELPGNSQTRDIFL